MKIPPDKVVYNRSTFFSLLLIHIPHHILASATGLFEVSLLLDYFLMLWLMFGVKAKANVNARFDSRVTVCLC